MYYVHLKKGLNDRGNLYPADKVNEYIDTSETDFYTSLYFYSEEQYQEFQKSGSVSGITDVVTNRLFLDMDNIHNLDQTQRDSLVACDRLQKFGINKEQIKIFYSGKKGFSLEVEMDRYVNPKELRAIVLDKLGTDLTTLDRVVYNPTRVIRVPGTKHQETGRYKIPLTYNELLTLSIPDIQKKAESLDNISEEFNWTKATPNVDLFDVKLPAAKTEMFKDINRLDFNLKPKFLSNCRWSLQNGFFSEGNRNSALMCLAATYKNLGFDIELTYRLLKGVCELESRHNKTIRFSEDELYNNVVLVVYGSNWRNGQYSCREKGNWLHDYCTSLGDNKCVHKDDSMLSEIATYSKKFQDFTANLDKNIIKTGIPAIDRKVMLSTGMLVGLLGGPSVGKTQVTFHFLNEQCKNNVNSVFFSMDMSMPLVYTRILQKHTGLKKEEIYKTYAEGGKRLEEFNNILFKNYKNALFSFKGGLRVEDMRNAIIDLQEKKGEKIKFVAIDYLECIPGEFSDTNANTGLIAQQLKDMANELECCVMLLLQTQKASGDPSEPLLSMRKIKGSSQLEQAASVVLTLSRPGFSPTHPEDDKYITISSVKDRMGPLFSADLSWDGLTGTIKELDDLQKDELEQVRQRKAHEREAQERQWD